MKISILTLFPEMFTPLKESIIGRAVKQNKIEINIINVRDFTLDKHKKCDDYPFGGGAGMVMSAQPIASAIDKIDPNHLSRRIFMSPKGKTFTQNMVKTLIEYKDIILLCGHYEGVDQRVLDLYFDEEISIGDYVLTGGELPAMVITDALARYIDGVISLDSLSQESFNNNLLEYPHYTRPQIWNGIAVPEVLVSGNHQEVDKWRKETSLSITNQKRPDLLEKIDK